jgi:hypothetical protein
VIKSIKLRFAHRKPPWKIICVWSFDVQAVVVFHQGLRLREA